MRTQVVLIALSLLVAGIAFAPAVSAEGDECTKPSSTGVHKACGKTWVVNNTVQCVWNGYWYEVDGRAVAYREYRCSGPDQS